jgi:phosphoribosyl 1,2-cyclic phosphodiesterase
LAAILLTHARWDHIQGFSFFAPLFAPRDHVEVYGPERSHVSLRDALAR